MKRFLTSVSLAAFVTFAENNQEDIDESLNSIKEYISGIYESEEIQSQIEMAVWPI